MKRNDFKSLVADFLTYRVMEWFDDKPFFRGIGISLINANVNKFDKLLTLFENEEGEIDAVGLIENMDIKEPIKIDLQQYSPLLPNRVLLITKEDFEELLNDVRKREKG